MREGFFAKDASAHVGRGCVYLPGGRAALAQVRGKSRELTKIDYSNRSACLACAACALRRAEETFRRLATGERGRAGAHGRSPEGPAGVLPPLARRGRHPFGSIKQWMARAFLMAGGRVRPDRARLQSPARHQHPRRQRHDRSRPRLRADATRLYRRDAQRHGAQTPIPPQHSRRSSLAHLRRAHTCSGRVLTGLHFFCKAISARLNQQATAAVERWRSALRHRRGLTVGSAGRTAANRHARALVPPRRAGR